MIPELGHFALILALAVALVQAAFPLAGAALGIPGWQAVARPAARVQFGLLLVAFACLVQAFIANDFTVAYVAQNSNSLLPLYYRISAVWGAHEGSLLLWVLILGLWTVAVTVFSRHLPDVFLARVVGVMGLISIGFLLFMLLTSNPFARLLPPAIDGRDLNPLLQDFGLIVHPPVLYTGYVGFSVAFAFAIAALLGGQLDAAWARWSRPWTTIAWVFLTVGIAMGSWWAYYELGWGGWWFWDPVENASFMPWLVGTALIHSLAVTEKRGAFRAWTVLLAITAFSLSLLGTFLVRSGVLTSVHAFATDPARGLFILIFLVAVVGGSLLLYAWRAPRLAGGGSFDLLSRETLLLLNNVLFAVAAATVLLGTLYPLVLDALGAGKISVGPPYFNTVFIPLMLPAALLAGVGPLVRWKRDELSRVAWELRYGVLATVLLAVPAVLALTPLTWGAALGIALALWVAASSLLGVWDRVRHRPQPLRALLAIPRGFYGMTAAHLGLGVFIVGVTLVSLYDVERDLRFAPGETADIGGYTFRFEGVRDVQGPNFRAAEGTFRVFSGDDEVALLRTQKRIYTVQTSPMTEAGIDPGLFRDLYVSLGEPLENGAWSARLYYKPFVRWIWLGALLMALGGVLAATDRRYRLQAARQRAPAPSAALAAEG
ncbi:MAG: heme lyase CcmF/NrfE family subunit [Pseudomonadota bacterium]|nr:heme lyase CcmF/NrfE family subunit [Pseudomonadota bacterium]